MNQSPTTPLTTVTGDEDQIEQAHPDHGVPSQDPASAAQFPLEAEEAQREANSALTGGGLVAGAATGAAIGVVVAGPVGAVVGGSLGAVVGALGAAAAGTMVNPQDSIGADTAPADIVRMHTGGSAGGGRPTAQVDNLGKDFGVFYPRGHMVVAFQAHANLEQLAQGLKDLGQATTDHLEVTSHQMIEFAERNIQEAGVIATLGTSVTTLQGFLDAARKDAVFLIVPTPDDETAEQVTTVLRGVPHLLAERYRVLAIETVV